MARVALLEYCTTPQETVVFLARTDLEAPLVFEARDGVSGAPVTRERLLRCAQRLLIDFHGLPPGWDRSPQAGVIREALALDPAVSALKRTQAVLEGRLQNPRLSYKLTYWEQLSDALLPPALRSLLHDCELLCIVPHGPLHSLPFAALRWSDREYLVERFGLCFLPSASVLRYCQAKNRARRKGVQHRPSSCCIAAVASADDEEPADFEADGAALAALVPRRVTRLTGARPARGRRPASKELICRTIRGRDIVHLACHGVFGPEAGSADPLDSGLLVSDGLRAPPLAGFSLLSPAERRAFLLSAREIFGLQLTADLVTLRACSSGRAAIQSGDELIGLSRAFLYAGAPSLLVSLWNVNKHSSQRLLNEFYRLWLAWDQPQSKWRALQQAQVQLMRDGTYTHPYHWAAFILVGDWL